MNNLDEKLVERLVGRIEELNTNILKKIGKTIKEIKKITPTQAHQLEKILKYGNNYKDIVNKIAKTTNLNIDEIDNIFNAYAKQDYAFAKDFYDYKGITYKSYKDFELLNRQVQSLARITQQGCLEIVKTNALGYTITDLNGNVRFKQLKDAYQYAIDQAILSISQGKDTFDNQMYGILKDLGGGLKTIDYDSGRTRRLDSALRMNLMGGLRDLHNETQRIIGEDFGANGVEITVHEAPAPDHADLQGKQFSYVEYEKLQNNMSAKDYKGHIYTHDHRPISQFNCYHTTFAILLGVNKPQYTNEQLKQIKQRNEKGFDFEGKHYTMYEGTQLQRRLETEIRKQKDTQILAKESDNNLLINSTQQKITQLSNKYKQLSNASGLSMKQDRLRVSGYKRMKVEIKKSKTTTEYKIADSNLIDKYYKKAEEIDKTLKADEWLAVKHYTGVGFQEINEYLENGTALYDIYENDKEIMKDITNLENVIKRNTIDDNLVVYKGTYDNLWSNIKIGEEKITPVFNSTSLKEEIGNDFAKKVQLKGGKPAILEIRTPKGTQGIPVGDLYSSQNEHEIILNRNLNYKLIEIQEATTNKYKKYILEVIK